MRRSNALGKPTGFALLIVALAGLACFEAAVPSRAVLARFPDMAGPRAASDQVQLVSFGDTARHAICNAETSSFDVRLPSHGAHSATFHFAARGADAKPGSKPPIAQSEIGFRVRVLSRDRSRILFDASSHVGDERWRSHRFELEPLASESDASLRFETIVPPGAHAVEGCWAAVVVSGVSESAAAGPRPHVILISLDTLGASHLSSFAGAPGTSPRIDDFLAESHSFRRAYAPYGNTLTSHSSIFSGLYPRRHGRYGIFTPLRSLVSEFANSGYRTAAFTEVGFVRSNYGFAQGFDSYVDAGGNSMPGLASETFSRAATWIREHADLGPFFLFLHTYEVHSPYRLRDQRARQFAAQLTSERVRTFEPLEHAIMGKLHNSGSKPMSSKTLALWSALYRAEINHLDIEVGRFLDTLEELGIARDSLVILTSDHGELFGEDGKVGHGWSMHNRGLHVPLAFRWPGHIAPASTEAAVSLVDILPTIFELLEIEVAESPDAVSLAEVLSGRKPSEARVVLAEGNWCIRRDPKDCPEPRQVAAFRGDLKLLRDLRTGTQQLHDLRADPLELRDRSDDDAQAVAELAREIDRYLEIPIQEVTTGKQFPIDPDERARLRALGYEE